MKYKVVGANRDTGARMSLEFEAESKSAAERKATQQGMSVSHVQDVTDGEVAHTLPGRARRSGGGRAGLIRLVVILAIVAALAYYFWPKIRHMIGQ